jgi:hypothetical protein
MFGAIKEHTKRLIIEFVEDRTTQTLERIIGHYILPGSTLHSDGWNAYAGINLRRFGLRRIEHIKEGSRTFFHSNALEGLWGELKYQIKNING